MGGLAGCLYWRAFAILQPSQLGSFPADATIGSVRISREYSCVPRKYDVATTESPRHRLVRASQPASIAASRAWSIINQGACHERVISLGQGERPMGELKLKCLLTDSLLLASQGERERERARYLFHAQPSPTLRCAALLCCAS